MKKFSNERIKELSIDCVIFGFKKTMNILLIKREHPIENGKWALPGGFIRYDENLISAAERILEGKTSIKNLYMEQLKVFGALDRYPERRVLTIPFFALVKEENYEIVPNIAAGATESRWCPIDKLMNLPFDHNAIIQFAFEQLQRKVRHEPIGFNLLPAKFTLLQLQNLYEAILCIKLDKPNFRRRFMKMNLLIDCNEKEQNVTHRAAQLYRFDEKIYHQLKEQGFSFEFHGKK